VAFTLATIGNGGKQNRIKMANDNALFVLLFIYPVSWLMLAVKN